MKKITLLLFLMLLSVWHVDAQFTEGFDTEIPATWTVINQDGGSFTWDFQTEFPQAGAGHARIHWETAAHNDFLISPQFAVTAGVSDRISFYAGIDGTFFTETFDVRISTTGNAAADFTTVVASETATTDADGNYTQYTYDLTAFNGQSVYVAIVATDTDRFYLYIDTFVNDALPTSTLDYYNLQFPASGTINAGDDFIVYAQAYEAGLTDVTSGPSPGIEAWIGYSSTNTDPSGSGWTWVPATFNVETGNNNNDEYQLNLGAVINTTGTLYYASRWSLNEGPFTYGGIQADASFGGMWGDNNNISGVLTVNAPANDDCSGAIALTVNSDFSCGNVTGSTTLGATASPQPDDATGTPNNDVWFTFVATGSAHQIVISNVVNLGGGTSTSVDMGMSVFNDLAGCNMVAANEVGESDPNTLSLTGLTSGNTYYVRVYGWSTTIQNNNFDICVGTPPPAPANDECENAVTLTVNTDLSCGVVTAGTTVSATASPQADDVSGTPNNDVWFSFVATNSALQVSLTDVVAVTGSSTDMAIGVYDGTEGCSALVFTATSDPNTLGLSGLTVGTTYYVRVYGFSSTASTAQTNFNICVGTPPPPPANDDCNDALTLTSSADNTCANLVTGTTVSANPTASGACSTAGKDVWYTFVPSQPGDYQFTVTEITDYGTSSTYVTVYSGSCGGLTQFGSSCTTTSTSANGLVSGTTYYVNVRSSSTSTGVDFSLCTYPIVRPANNNFANAQALICGQNVTGSTALATLDEDSAPDGFGADMDSPNVWYSYTGSGVAETITLNMCPSDYDSSFLVYTGTSGNLTLVAGNDDGGTTNCPGAGTRSFGEFLSDGTSTYYIAVEGFNSTSVGNFNLTLTCSAVCTPAQTNQNCASALPLLVDGNATTVDNTCASVNAVQPSCDSFGAIADIWYTFEAPSAEVTIISTLGTATAAHMAAYSGACGTLTSLSCSVSETGNLTLTGLTAGTTYYLQLWNNGSEEGTFDVTLTDATLSVGDVENPNAFSYFPNPVKNELKLRAQSNIQNVSIYNMLGQEVLRTAPKTLESDISMNELQTGAYFVKVTINDATETIRVIKQ